VTAEVIRDEEFGPIDLSNKSKNQQKRKKLMNDNTEKLERTKYSSPGHWERPLERTPNIRLNPQWNINTANTRVCGSA